METLPIDFTAWGLEGAWASRRWAEPIYGRRDKPMRGVRLGHASDTAMVLVCTYPRDRFDAELARSGANPVRELAYETTFALVNLALHQIRVPGTRPDGLIGSLVQFASQQADLHAQWATAQWGPKTASVVGLAGWQSGFSLAYPDCYVVVHACGIATEKLRLRPTQDLSTYGVSSDLLELGVMHWELWRGEPDLGYDDLAPVLVAR